MQSNALLQFLVSLIMYNKKLYKFYINDFCIETSKNKIPYDYVLTHILKINHKLKVMSEYCNISNVTSNLNRTKTQSITLYFLRSILYVLWFLVAITLMLVMLSSAQF